METNTKKKLFCKVCNYFTKNKYDFKKHLQTKKHLNKFSELCSNTEDENDKYSCSGCGKLYKYKGGLIKHRETCPARNIEENDEFQQKKEKDIYDEKMQEFIEAQNKNMKSLVETLESAATSNQNAISNLASKVGNTTNNYNTMTINLFLNKECANAMNLTDFIESLKLNYDDLQYTCDNGYAKGITNIFVKNLNQLEPTERPIHCSDKNNCNFYIKEENVWSEDKMNEKIDNSIETISKKQILKIKEWQSHNPNWANTENGEASFMKMIKELMGNSSKVKNAHESIKKDLGNNLDIGTLIENDDN
tara:strand:+ start:26 stop:943 length:918 start_codon:yes stop_codon:yes gene_type:complete